MTRINVIPPEKLSDRHLVAEYRELPRIFNLVRKAVCRGENPEDMKNPAVYTLGKGHVRFFYNKCEFLRKRQEKLIQEMLDRGFNPQYREVNVDLPDEWCQDYEPTKESIKLNVNRINERGGLK